MVPVSLGRPDDGGAGGYRIDGRRKSGGDVGGEAERGRPLTITSKRSQRRGLFQQLLIAYQEMEYRLEHSRFSVGFQKEVYDAQVNVWSNPVL
ncbi:hypothetical protein V1477_010215 [Vespula maculifrons]|uniref:Uncharacterized protein n=1 Tax=Vespula maculifrons TaxID=7453 RepID=A0ABD2C821_VESMC